MNIKYQAPPLPGNDDLLKQLKEATERKGPAPMISDFAASDPPADQPPSGLKEDDFIEESAPIREVEPEAPPIPVNYKEQAKLMIAFFDGLQGLVLPGAYQHSYFTDEEREKLKDFKKRLAVSGSQAETIITESDQEIYDKYQDVEELIDNLPFTEKEVKMLENPTAAYMEKYKFNPGPETALIMALLAVMGPRVAPLIIKLR